MSAGIVSSQEPQRPGRGFGGPGGDFGGGPPPGFRGPPGPGGERQIAKQFDKDGDGRLNNDERKAARASLGERGGRGPGGGPGGGFGPPGGRGEREVGKPGPKISPADVQPISNASLYEPTVLRTLFLQFENGDWERELADFNDTDVEVPATLIADGKAYSNVGVHFRGNSSFMMVGEGSKRSLNLSLDFVDPQQRLYGYKTLNLLNMHEDSSLMSTVLYSHIARQYIPAPKANFIKLVINGESWGVYANVQQFNKEFLAENFKTDKGARWKVRANPGGGSGLEYMGDNSSDYKRLFEIKSSDNEKAWQALVNLCKTLNQTPPEKLEAALEPLVDIDGLLWFLALDMALINNDGYWVRASDFSIFLDDKGKFHFIPHDMNEAFRPGGGPGFGGPGGPGGFGPGGMPLGDVSLPRLLQRAGVNLSEEQQKQLAELQKEADARLERILNDEQRRQFRELRGDAPPGVRGPDDRAAGERGPGGRGPGGFGPGGPGFGGPGGGRGGGMELDPLIGLDDPRKPLRSKVLAVPGLRERYLHHVRTVAEKSLDWKRLGPVVAQYRQLIEKEVEADTRKLSSYDAFLRVTAESPDEARGSRGRELSLRTFAEVRGKFLLDYQPPK